MEVKEFLVCYNLIYIILIIFTINLVAIHSNTKNTIEPITKIFPKVFNDLKYEIFVSNESIHNIDPVYKIQPFSVIERNHYKNRSNNSTVKYLIMHYTEAWFASTIYIFTSLNKTDNVSSHYVITTEENETLVKAGQVIQVVSDNMCAFHTGKSAWKNDVNLNHLSIGIEHVNYNDIPYNDRQIETSGILSKDLVKTFDIKPNNVLGHQDIAPNRKSDPGYLFPWSKFYSSFNVGAWLSDDEFDVNVINQKYKPKMKYPNKVDCCVFVKLINTYGYKLNDKQILLLNSMKCTNNIPGEFKTQVYAFRAHFSANRNETQLKLKNLTSIDMFWAWALVAKYAAFL